MNAGQKHLKELGVELPYEMTWLEGDLKNDYLHDVKCGQEYASLSRHVMVDEILRGMKWKADDVWDCPHNYIAADSETLSIFNAPILRKGAISAKEGERVVIPINMKEGIILGTGLGNKEWNCSAPHGAGRLMKRADVKNHFTLSHFKAEMKGIYSSCVGKETLDEAPFAYRTMKDIASVIGDTVRIEQILTPVYNYKAGSKD